MAQAETIKSLITMGDIFQKYGFDVGRNGFLCCPFHQEKTASLKAYKDDTRWHCFGCGAGGDVITFVMMLYHINFSQAIVRINSDFALGLTNEKPDSRTMAKIAREKAKKKRELDAYRAEYDKKILEYRRLWHAKLFMAPKSTEDVSDEYIEACHKLPVLEHYFDTHDWR